MAATPETTADSGQANQTLDRVREALGRLNNQQKLILMVAIAALIAIVIGASLWARQPDYRVLFSNLSEKDGGAIITALEQQNIPHKFAESNGAILVPGERVHEVRLRLATQGLPRGGSVGFELMETPKFGLSQFAEQVNYQRALEGELARTIQSVGAVQAARVHLAIPKPSVFVREEQKPTASVLLTLYAGRALDAGQVAGITYLVASSVPQMPVSNVSVLDQNGNLLSQLKSKMTEAGLDPAQIKYVREVEGSIIKRIEEILKPVVGEDNFKVQVAADVDFSQTEQTAETYRPNNAPDSTVIRSQQNAESANVAGSSGGVPGALTNQPPVPATAPLTTPATGTAGTPATSKPGELTGKIDAAGVTAPLNAAGQPVNATKNSTINYEVDKTIRHTKQAMGAVRRLSAAVVINHRKEVGKDGKPITKALPDAELKQINELVREAMGFSKDRGDSLSLANTPFTATEKQEVSIPIWEDSHKMARIEGYVKWLAIFGIAAFLWFKVIQPILKTMTPPPAAGREGAEGEEGAIGGTISTTDDEFEAEEAALSSYAAKINKAREIADKDPKVVANMIKEWMGTNAT